MRKLGYVEPTQATIDEIESGVELGFDNIVDESKLGTDYLKLLNIINDAGYIVADNLDHVGIFGRESVLPHVDEIMSDTSIVFVAKCTGQAYLMIDGLMCQDKDDIKLKTGDVFVFDNTLLHALVVRNCKWSLLVIDVDRK